MSPKAGDPQYAGFRITSLWAVTAVDPADDQEGVCAFQGPDGAWMPLVGSDRNRLVSFLEPMAEELRAENPTATVKHFVLLDEAGLRESLDVTTVDPDYTEHVREGLLPKVKDSAFVMSLFTDSEPDVKQCMELAAALLYKKPMLFMVTPGAEVPEHLLRLADKVVEWDPEDSGKQAFIGGEIAEFMRERGLTP